MANLVKKVFTRSTTWTTPGGVENFIVKPIYDYSSVMLYADVIGARLGSFITEGGNIYSMGINQNTFGNNSITSSSSPLSIFGGLKFGRANPGDTRFGITTNGETYAWGRNTNGALGTNDVLTKSTPVTITNNLAFCYVYTTAGQGSTSSYGLTINGTLYSWGTNNSGQLLIGSTTNVSTPTLVNHAFPIRSFAEPVSAGNHCGFINSQNQGFLGGLGGSGQLGNNSTANFTNAQQVVGGYSWSKLICGNARTFGITLDGDLYAWGNNIDGCLGVGDITSRSSPTLVLGGHKWVDMVSIGNTSYAIKTSGEMYSWGNDNNGQLGRNTTGVSVSSPVLVLGGNKFKKFCTPHNQYGPSMLALTTSGALAGFGSNNYGQLGNGTTTQANTPTFPIPNYSFADAIMSQTGESVLAVTTDGKLYGWGENTQGQLGIGTTTSVSTPTAVVGGFSAQVLNKDIFGNYASEINIKTEFSGLTIDIILTDGISKFNDIPVSIGRLKELEVYYTI